MGAEYTSRIHRVIDYIEAHLGDELSLDELARVACFSSYHFHRLFSALVGEPLGHFIQRLRLEKAASRLLHSPGESVTSVALDCGFSSSAAFARAFRRRFGLSASQWRACQGRPEGAATERGEAEGAAPCGGYELSPPSLNPGSRSLEWSVRTRGARALSARIEVKELPTLHLAYVRHVGPYQGDSELFGRLFGTLMQWAGPRGLLARPDAQSLITYHDDPEITDDAKLRVSVCLTVPPETEAEGPVGRLDLDAGAYAIGHFELDVDQFGEAWGALYGGWLPDSGYQPDDRLAFELCRNAPQSHPQGKHVVDICVPVRPL